MTQTAYERAADFMDQQLKVPMRQAIVGRPLFAKTTDIPSGKFVVDYDSITDMGEAEVSYEFTADDTSMDMIKVSESSIRMAVIKKSYKIPKQQMMAFEAAGRPLDTAAMLSAMYVVAKKEDSLLIDGWAPDGTNYKINGLYKSAGNSYTTSTDFATYGHPSEAVIGALALLAADNIMGVNWNLVLNPTQYFELMASQYENVYELDHVLKLLNPVAGAPGGGVVMSNDIIAGTGLMSPVDPTGMMIDLIRMFDVQNDIGVDSKRPKTSDLFGTVYEVLVPRVTQANSVCSMTQI